jgi:nitroreductase
MLEEGHTMHPIDLATADRLLTTTRSVRKRLDLTRPVEPEIVERCLEIAFQAPTGSNAQGWHFLVVTDEEPRRRLAELYRRGAELLMQTFYADVTYPADDPRAAQFPRMLQSGMHLYEHLHEVPVLIVPCIEGRPEAAGTVWQATLYGSIFPALALRARGIDSRRRARLTPKTPVATLCPPSAMRTRERRRRARGNGDAEEQ